MLLVRVLTEFCLQRCKGETEYSCTLDTGDADLLRHTPAIWKDHFCCVGGEHARDGETRFFPLCFPFSAATCTLGDLLPVDALEIRIDKMNATLTQLPHFELVAKVAEASAEYYTPKSKRGPIVDQLKSLREKWDSIVVSEPYRPQPQASGVSMGASLLHPSLANELRGILERSKGDSRQIIAPPGFLVEELLKEIEAECSADRPWVSCDANGFGEDVDGCFQDIYEGLCDTNMFEPRECSRVADRQHASRCKGLINSWNQRQQQRRCVLVIKNLDAYATIGRRLRRGR